MVRERIRNSRVLELALGTQSVALAGLPGSDADELCILSPRSDIWANAKWAQTRSEFQASLCHWLVKVS